MPREVPKSECVPYGMEPDGVLCLGALGEPRWKGMNRNTAVVLHNIATN
jgi:hypothetical protein